MIGRLDWHGQSLEIDFARGLPLAIPLDPHGPQPSFFAAEPARAEPLEVGDYLGSVARGGSCNAETLHYTPHCHGTHTECVAHLSPERGSAWHEIERTPCLARLITLSAAAPEASTETYAAAHGSPLLTRAELEPLLSSAATVHALVVRTLPNAPDKQHRDYAQVAPYPVFSDEAMKALAASELRHLLVDTPSLDAAQDGGQLSNHRRWWGLSAPGPGHATRRSVTEMIYVPDGLPDALYWLQLGLQPLISDAVASDPVIYPLQVATT